MLHKAKKAVVIPRLAALDCNRLLHCSLEWLFSEGLEALSRDRVLEAVAVPRCPPCLVLTMDQLQKQWTGVNHLKYDMLHCVDC